MIIGDRPVLMTKKLLSVCKKKFNKINSHEYEKKLFESGVRMLLSGVKLSTATLIDYKFKYKNIADILLGSFKTVKIITACKEQYQKYIDAKLYECGAVLSVTDKLELSKETELCISPDGITFEAMNLTDVPIISKRQIPITGSKTIHSFKTKCAHIPPSGIDTQSYLAAIYQYCGIRANFIINPTTAFVNENEETIDKIKINLFSIDRG